MLPCQAVGYVMERVVSPPVSLAIEHQHCPCCLAQVKAEAEDEAAADEGEEGGDDDGARSGAAAGGGFNYLLSMPIWSLTWEKVQKLQAEAAQQAALVEELTAISDRQMWARDLDAFVVVRWGRLPVPHIAAVWASAAFHAYPTGLLGSEFGCECGSGSTRG